MGGGYHILQRPVEAPPELAAGFLPCHLLTTAFAVVNFCCGPALVSELQEALCLFNTPLPARLRGSLRWLRLSKGLYLTHDQRLLSMRGTPATNERA